MGDVEMATPSEQLTELQSGLDSMGWRQGYSLTKSGDVRQHGDGRAVLPMHSAIHIENWFGEPGEEIFIQIVMDLDDEVSSFTVYSDILGNLGRDKEKSVKRLLWEVSNL